MNKEIRLSEYINYGGSLSKIDWSKARCGYSDENTDKEIISCEDRGDIGGGGINCFWLKYRDGTESRYATSWIYVNVIFKLDESYFD